MSEFNFVRNYINRDLITDMWNTFLYYNCSVDTTLLGLVKEHDYYISVPLMNEGILILKYPQYL